MPKPSTFKLAPVYHGVLVAHGCRRPAAVTNRVHGSFRVYVDRAIGKFLRPREKRYA